MVWVSEFKDPSFLRGTKVYFGAGHLLKGSREPPPHPLHAAEGHRSAGYAINFLEYPGHLLRLCQDLVGGGECHPRPYRSSAMLPLVFYLGLDLVHDLNALPKQLASFRVQDAQCQPRRPR